MHNFFCLFFPLLDTCYKTEDIKDDHCQRICRNWLLFLGIREGKTWNLHSLLTLLTLTHSLGIWSYSFMQSESGDSTDALHHISLSLLALGLFLLQAFNHDEIMSVARQADNCINCGSASVKPAFKAIQKKLFTSWIKMYTDIFTIIVFLTWANILAMVYTENLFVQNVKPPPGMILPFESQKLYVYMHITETMFIIVACFADVMVAQFFMVFSLQLTANLEILCHSLEIIQTTSTNPPCLLSDSSFQHKLSRCIQHHQEIFLTFSSLKKLFDQIFYLLYFSMMGAIAMCRTLLSGSIDVGHLLPVFYLETGYIHTFCAFADKIAEASESVRFAAYSTDWLNFSRSLCCSIRIIVIRASKTPKIHFYLGGGEISCATFTMIINASLTYFVVSILMERKNYI